METDYSSLQNALRALTEDVPYPCANLSNAAALLYLSLQDINWAGFYLYQDHQLILGPFQGKPACTIIPLHHGVCGTAAASGKVQRVPDVHAFPGHIACDSASKSEIVLPIYVNKKLYGVLDIDSPLLNRFSEADEEGLKEFVRLLESRLTEPLI